MIVIFKDLFQLLKTQVLNDNPNFQGYQETITEIFLVLKR